MSGWLRHGSSTLAPPALRTCGALIAVLALMTVACSDREDPALPAMSASPGDREDVIVRAAGPPTREEPVTPGAECSGSAEVGAVRALIYEFPTRGVQSTIRQYV